MKPTFTIAVRTLVAQVLRSGDLQFDYFSSVSAAEGIRAHQKLRRRRPDNYQAEVPVTHTVENEAFTLIVTGRVDGILVEPSRVVIEEIKTTRRSNEDLAQTPNPVHWGQAQLYAHMWAAKEKLPSVAVRLTYIHPDTGKTLELERNLDAAALADFFEELVGRYAVWLDKKAAFVDLRDRSIKGLSFPFDTFRGGQREMAIAVYRTIGDSGHLLVQAATGIGKTMAAIFPTIKALDRGESGKVIFLTARTTGRLAAESAISRLMNGNGLRMKSVSLTAKDKICFFPQSVCAPDACECAKGYFDRINEAILNALDHDAWTRGVIERIAMDHQVCPFEFSLELVNWADFVICDYNYAFAPGVMLQRLFEEDSGKHIVLVDEAHNMVDRCREMFSAQLDKQQVLALRRLVKDELPGVYRSLGRVNACMAAARRRCNQAGQSLVEDALPMELIERLRAFLNTAEKWLAHNLRTPFRDALLELFFDALRFARVAENYDQRYSTIYQGEGSGLRVKLFCIDPSHQLRQCWSRCRSAVLFSATLTPVGYFQSVLGCLEQAVMLNLPSPFPQENLSVFVADKISTLYQEREQSCHAVVSVIVKLVRQHQGHYLLFFPSYAYMHRVYDQFVLENVECEVVVQKPDMTEDDRSGFLSRFKKEVGGTLVGFAVMGGIFGEGIDLKGDRLTGAVIVGVGLPGMSVEQNLIRDYYDRSANRGFEFACQFPGINRVLQAAGRVIRSEEDRGVVLLIDKRYSQHRYRSLLPRHWHLQTVGDQEAFARQLRCFWAGGRGAQLEGPSSGI